MAFNNIRIQWGKCSFTANQGNVTVTFPTSFSACYNVNLTGYGNSFSYECVVKSFTNSNFVCASFNISAYNKGYYQAIGKA